MDAGEFESLGLYDPTDEHAALRLELLRYLVDLGASADDLIVYRDTLPGLASALAIRGGPLLTVEEVGQRSGLAVEEVGRLVRAAGYWYFNRWEQYRVTEQIVPVVREQLRIAEGRNPQPSAGLIDSQTVKGADTVGRESRGQNVAIGLTGLPDVPAKRTGATARWKSHWPSSAAVVAHTSRSQLSSSHRPIATRLTA